MAVHFVGFRTDAEYLAAVRAFGKPDFIHRHHDNRMRGDVDMDHDLVVLGSRGREEPCKFSDQDHERH